MNASTNNPPLEQTFFEEQREMLVLEIAQSLQSVLHNMNKLNRSLEEVIAVGNEFSPVEALWSRFEEVMARDPEGAEGQQGEQNEQQQREDGSAGEEEREVETEGQGHGHGHGRR